jgi:hypothetical protein
LCSGKEHEQIFEPNQPTMKIPGSLYGFVCLLILSSMDSLQAQDNHTDSISIRKESVRLFLDCDHCDVDYIRMEIPYVNYVRDVKEAQVYVLMTEQEAGNGGREYTFSFEGQKEFRGLNDTLQFTSMPDDTEEQVRSEQLKILKMGLMRYIARTPLYREIEISHSKFLDEQQVTDRWRNWVFEIQVSPFFEGEETYKELSLFNSLNVRKITDNWKLEFDLDHHYNRVSYNYEDTSYTAFRNAEDLENLIVKSINEHWSLGGEVNFRASTFSNYKFQFELMPAVEYNIFPYSESTRRQLRMLYTIGYTSNLYNDTTIYDQIREGRFQHSFRMAYEVKQKWGSIDVSMQASNFLHDFSMNRIELGGHIEIRIVKGLSFEIFGDIARVRNQISLAKEELSEAEILLRLQEMATGYYYFGGVGLSYTFGSIYNNVVNPRFGHY